jgi:seryl-tRNA synthetase
MKNLKTLIIIYIVIIFSFYYYHNDKVESLNSEIESLTIEKELTQNKLNIIESAMKDMVKSRPNGTVNVIKTKKTDRNNSHIDNKKPESKINDEDLVKVIIKNTTNDDPSVSSKFPNRRGQDLVNSLKLKTEL